MDFYGLRDAPQMWADHFPDALRAAGFEQSPTAVGTFVHRGRDIRLAVHMDDVVAIGEVENVVAIAF